jgi:hypothetical protein
MTTSLTFAQFRNQFGATPERERLLDEFDKFLGQLRINFANYRVLVYGSFLSQKLVPGDLDVMVSVSSTLTDPGFNRFIKLQELATEEVDVFTLNLKSNFDLAEPVPNAESMVLAFNTREAHVAKGIQCKEAIEIT